VKSKSRATTIFLRSKSPPWGFNGGMEATPGRNVFFPDTSKEKLVSTGALDMEPGETVRVISAGGGGWGNPLQRDPELVKRDVEYGYVSMEGAKRNYGVIVKKHGRRYEIDLPATKRARAVAKLRKKNSNVKFTRGRQFREG
jgi:N-methylhydantoinase B